MFGTIRKHQTWLWGIIITLTIISFVIFFSPYSKLNPGRARARLGSIYGAQITEEQFIRAQREAMLQIFFMNGGRWPDQESQRSGYDPERETYQWLMLTRKIDQEGIHIAPDMAAEVGRDMIGQFQRAGISSAQAFQQQVLAQRGFGMDDFERFVHHYLGIQELVSTMGLAGRLVTPEEARALWIRENQELSTEAVFFKATNYLASINPTPQVLSQYYTNHLAEYRIPERMQVKYVEFGVSNYIPAAEAELMKTNLTELINANMERLGTNYTRLGKTPDEAKAKIREELIKNRALFEARKKANDFAVEVFEKQPMKAENLETVAQAKGLTAKSSEPFDRRDGPKGLEAPNFATAAFKMDLTNEPFAGPVIGPNGVYVMAFDRRLPSEVPTFEQVKDKVMNDYKIEQATSMARSAGMAFALRATNAVSQSKDLAAVAAENKYEAVTLPTFSLTTRSMPVLEDRLSINELKQLAFGTQPGHVSAYQPTMDGGIVLYVKAKLPIDEAKLNSEQANFVNAVRQNRQTEAFNEWFRREANVALRDTPLGQPRTPPPSMTAGRPGTKTAKK